MAKYPCLPLWTDAYLADTQRSTLAEFSPTEMAEIVRLWETGLSASKIGKAIGRTKNAVIGKARRMGLERRASPIKMKAPPKPGAVFKSRPHHVRSVQPPWSPAPGSLTNGRCQWIDGEPIRNAEMCGKPTVLKRDRTRSSWCAHHYERAFRKVWETER